MLLVLDERGQEVSRAVGYRSPDALAAFLAESRRLLDEPIEVAALAVAIISVIAIQILIEFVGHAVSVYLLAGAALKRPPPFTFSPPLRGVMQHVTLKMDG